MTAGEAREAVQECRGHLSDAMRALSVPEPDGEAAVSALRACADLCDRLVVRIVSDRMGGGSWK